jgi:hypothetical protein
MKGWLINLALFSLIINILEFLKGALLIIDIQVLDLKPIEPKLY